MTKIKKMIPKFNSIDTYLPHALKLEAVDLFNRIKKSA
jgi:hypothetical protein